MSREIYIPRVPREPSPWPHYDGYHMHSSEVEHFSSGVSNENRTPNMELREERLIGALRDREIVDFVRTITAANYRSFFPGHETEAEDLVIAAFDLMSLIGSRIMNGAPRITSDQRLRTSFVNIQDRILEKRRQFSWLDEAYNSYRTKRAKEDFEQVRNHIRGPRVLDFGSGAGTFALELQRNGFDVHTADPLDYRTDEARARENLIPFHHMISPTDIIFIDDSFDTTFAISVLHHIDKDKLSDVLDGLHRVTRKRLIVKEDMLCTTDDLARYHVQDLMTEPFMGRYIQMNEEQQKHLLVMSDYFANIMGGFSIIEMNMPFEFNTIEGLSSHLRRHGFEPKQIDIIGFEPNKLHKIPQVIFVCDIRK